MRRLLLLPLTAVLLTGCGSSGDSATDTAAAPAAKPAAAAKSAPGQISMIDALKFTPAAITVKVGQKITWTNTGSIPHNVVAEKGATFQSDTFGKGKTFSYTPTKAGTISYVCTIHPGMEGTVTVSG